MEDEHRDGEPEDAAFERGMELLLTRAYEPPPYRDPFRDRLLDRLKQRQADLIEQRRAQRRTVLSFSAAFSGIAAAAAIVIMAMSLGGPGGATVIAPKDTPPPTVAEAPPPALAPLQTEPVQTAGLFATDAPVALKVIDPVEVAANGRDWTPVAAKSATELPRGGMLRVAANKPSAGLWVRDNTRMALNSDSRLCREGEHVKLDRGGAYIVVGPDDPPLALLLPRHCIEVMPGSEAYVKVHRDPRFAPGGEPAPQAAVVKGLAFVRDDRGEAPLFPGKLYALDRYVRPGYPAEPLTPPAAGAKQAVPPMFPALDEARKRRPALLPAVAADTATGTRLTETIQGRTFRWTDGRWIDTTAQPTDRRVRLPYLSARYLRFLRTHADLAPFFGLGNGKNVAVKHAATVYEVTDE